MENFNTLQPLISYLLSIGGFDKTQESWSELALKFNIGDEGQPNKKRADAARRRWKRFLGTKRGLEFKKAAIDKDGNIISYRIGRADEPKNLPNTDDLELKFITHTPNGGAYVRHEPIKEKKLTPKDIREVLDEVMGQARNVKEVEFEKKKGDVQILALGDVHIGMAADDNLFELYWNKKELFNRSDLFLKHVDRSAGEIILIFGGDIADGLKGMTNRGGHKLPQNLNDKDQLRVSKDFVLYLLDNIVELVNVPVKVEFVANSNHPGIIDFATGEIIKSIAPYRYGEQVKFNVEEKFFGSFKVNGTSHIYTHGYDEEKMKRGMPRFLQANHKELVKKYMKHIGVTDAYLHRFDQHQSSKIVYSDFTDIMTPAFSNPSSWVSMNYAADYKGGFTSMWIDEKGYMTYKLIEF